MERVVILSDLQGRFTRWKAWKSVLAFLKEFKPDKVILAGDVADNYTLSSYRSHPEEMATSFNTELRMIRTKILLPLRLAVRQCCEISYLPGNHEDRLNRYLMDRAPELWDLRWRGDTQRPRVLTFPWLLDLEALDIKWVGGGREVLALNKHLLVTHGSIARKHSGWSARQAMQDFKTSIVVGHCHRLGIFYEYGYGSRMWKGAENGHLCDVERVVDAGAVNNKQTYNWHMGFSVVYLYPNQMFHLEQAVIIHDRVYYGGKVYSG